VDHDRESHHAADAEDVQAVRETLRGDHAAFGHIVDRYTPVVYSLAVRYLGREEEAEDAVQEIFLRAFDALDRFHLSRRFYSWLYTIALNYLKNVKNKRRRRGSDKVLPYEDRVATADVQPPLADPPSELERSEGEALVRDAVRRLPPKYRDVLVLRQFQELSVSDVADILDLPEGTVKTNLHRAKKALAAMLTEGET
jgi:RNA polymerase sigma-70 factor, ECF subfamily